MTSDVHEWVVALRPEGMNEGTNTGGLVIELTDGEESHEVSRVLFVRRNSNNRTDSFKRKLLAELHNARLAADHLNEHHEEVQGIRDELAERRAQLDSEEARRHDEARRENQRRVVDVLAGRDVDRAA